MRIRRYKLNDCHEMAKLFYHTVHTVNAKDYTPEQLDAWAPGTINTDMWDYSFQNNYTLLVEDNGILIGFGDISESGYLDYLYVHKDYQRMGVATAICDWLETRYFVDCIMTNASITAKPFFEKRGYHVVKEQKVVRNKVELTNYLMEKPCDFT